MKSHQFGKDNEAEWIEARNLSPVIHEIGTPIDTKEIPVASDFDSIETAWIMVIGGEMGIQMLVVV